MNEITDPLERDREPSVDTTLSFSISVDSVPEPEEQHIEEDEIDQIIINDENQNEKKKEKEEKRAEKRREREKKREERKKLKAEKMKSKEGSKDGNKIEIVVDEIDEEDEEMDGFPEEIVNVKQKKSKLKRSKEVEEDGAEDVNGEVISDKEKKANRGLRRTQSESCMR